MCSFFLVCVYLIRISIFLINCCVGNPSHVVDFRSSLNTHQMVSEPQVPVGMCLFVVVVLFKKIKQQFNFIFSK